MLASTIFGSPLLPTTKGFGEKTAARTGSNEGMTMMNVVECSSRPQKKATAHHMKTRPKKTRPSEVRKKPAVYPPLPPLPSEWTLLEPAAAKEE